MTRPTRFRQADLRRALEAAALAGLKVQRFEIEHDGRIVVVTGESAPPTREVAVSPKEDAFVAWKVEHERRQASRAAGRAARAAR